MWEQGLTCHIADVPITHWQNQVQWVDAVAMNLMEKQNTKLVACINLACRTVNVLIMAEPIAAEP